MTINFYTRIHKHIDMNRVKELHEEKIKLKEIAKQTEERIREELKYLNSPEFSNWRWDLDEGMTTSALMTTTLPGTGDAINRTVYSGDSGSFTGPGSDIENTYASVSFGGNDYQAMDFTGGNGAFPGVFGNDGVYFGMPYKGQFAPTLDEYNVTTNTFEVTDTSVTFQAIAGNSSSTYAGTGLGNNGGSRPLRDLDVGVYVFDDKGVLDDYIVLGVVPKGTTSKTEFTFELPPSLFGKKIALNFYNSANEGPYRPFSWMVDQTCSFHPSALDSGSGTNFTAEIAYSILNYNTLASDNYYKQFSETTIAYFLWSKLQETRTGDSDWGDVDNTTAGWPAPVSGGTMGLWTDGNQDPPVPNPSPMTQADLERIVELVRSQFANQLGMNTTTYAIGNLNFQRKTPITVFVPLNSPEASAFIRTDPIMAGLSAEERKKKLIDMLNAGDEYLLKHLGLIGSSARPSDAIMPDSWEDAATNFEISQDFDDKPVPHDLYGDLAILGLSYAIVKTAIVAFGPSIAGIMKQGGYLKDLLIKGKPPGPFAGKAPRPPKINSSSKEIWNTNTGKYEVIKKGDPGWDWAQRALKDTGKNSFDAYKKTGEMPGGLQGWRPQQGFDPTRPASMGGPGSMPTPDVTTPGGLAAVGGAAAGGAAIGTAIYNAVKDAVNWGKGKKENYDYNGETIMENKKKSFKDITKKIPGYYDGKPAPLGFPMSPPPETINGYHPDLVTPEGQKKQAKRFNRLDPQSAKAMPPTGNPHIDKKVRAAAKKPK